MLIQQPPLLSGSAGASPACAPRSLRLRGSRRAIARTAPHPGRLAACGTGLPCLPAAAAVTAASAAAWKAEAELSPTGTLKLPASELAAVRAAGVPLPSGKLAAGVIGGMPVRRALLFICPNRRMLLLARCRPLPARCRPLEARVSVRVRARLQ